ncbi:hypothetical protein JKP88DRAFT_350483 [Tribonema minus]|uniref:PHD-type domain-containing protein n=1 Tax=Tribonema minus TaxID=303371 RepID=A0A836CA75_9STRA|nr:hypothetical protein JKP88DRAFT_350483 [Tribonema minus]
MLLGGSLPPQSRDLSAQDTQPRAAEALPEPAGAARAAAPAAIPAVAVAAAAAALLLEHQQQQQQQPTHAAAAPTPALSAQQTASASLPVLEAAAPAAAPAAACALEAPRLVPTSTVEGAPAAVAGPPQEAPPSPLLDRVSQLMAAAQSLAAPAQTGGLAVAAAAAAAAVVQPHRSNGLMGVLPPAATAAALSQCSAAGTLPLAAAAASASAAGAPSLLAPVHHCHVRGTLLRLRHAARELLPAEGAGAVAAALDGVEGALTCTPELKDFGENVQAALSAAGGGVWEALQCEFEEAMHALSLQFRAQWRFKRKRGAEAAEEEEGGAGGGLDLINGALPHSGHSPNARSGAADPASTYSSGASTSGSRARSAKAVAARRAATAAAAAAAQAQAAADAAWAALARTQPPPAAAQAAAAAPRRRARCAWRMRRRLPVDGFGMVPGNGRGWAPPEPEPGARPFQDMELDDRACCACSSGHSHDDDALVGCDGCGVAVHERCYGIQAVPEGDLPWCCAPCTFQLAKRAASSAAAAAAAPKPRCALCCQRFGAMKPLARAHGWGGKAQWAHVLCAWWDPDVNRLLVNVTLLLGCTSCVPGVVCVTQVLHEDTVVEPMVFNKPPAPARTTMCFDQRGCLRAAAPFDIQIYETYCAAHQHCRADAGAVVAALRRACVHATPHALLAKNAALVALVEKKLAAPPGDPNAYPDFVAFERHIRAVAAEAELWDDVTDILQALRKHMTS